MSFDYAATAQEVLVALADAGAPCTITWQPSPETDDPSAEQPEPVTVSAYGAIFEYNWKQLGTQNNSLIEVGDRQILLSAVDVNGAPVAEPPPNASVIGPDGKPYLLVVCKVLAPAGVAVMYDLNVRK